MIGRADTEFYEANLVMAVARSFLPEGVAWESLSHRQRQRWLDRAVGAVQAILNDEGCRERLRFLTQPRDPSEGRHETLAPGDIDADPYK